MESTRELLDIVFRHAHAGAGLPIYDVVEEHDDDVKDLLFRAIFETSIDLPPRYRGCCHLLVREVACK